MSDKLKISLSPKHLDKILDAIRDQAKYSDDQDKWLEILGEVQAQITIGKAYHVRGIKPENEIIQCKQEISPKPVFAKTRSLSTRTDYRSTPVEQKFKNPLRVEPKNDFLYDAF